MSISTGAQENGASKSFHKFDDLIRQINESDTFRKAPVMGALLLYLWEHQGQPISEYAIATEALGRASSFDPKTDSTVRVQIARLRAKLREFYETAGDSFPLRLTLPLGGHELRWTFQPLQMSFASKFSGIPKPYLWAAGLTLASLALLCIGLLFEVHRLKQDSPLYKPLPRLWRSFLTPGKITQIVVASPLYFYWPDHGISIRDLKISEFGQRDSSSLIKETSERWGQPQLSQVYVGAAEMRASVSVLQYLEKAGQPVALTESRRFSAALLSSQNTIFLGMPRNAGYLNQLLSKTNYYMESMDPDVIKSRNPRRGEANEYREVLYSGDRRAAPSIIILLPPSREHTRMLLLLGKYITATASILLTDDGLALVDQAWEKAGSPDAWEMVIEADIFQDAILKFSIPTCRAIPASFWK
jgi:hypothetical protein